MSRMLVSVCLALALASVSYADVIIGNWENGSSDGFGPAWGGPLVLMPGDWGNGSATLGTGSAAVLTGSSFWSMDYNGNPGDLTGMTKFSIDVTVIQSQWGSTIAGLIWPKLRTRI